MDATPTKGGKSGFDIVLHWGCRTDYSHGVTGVFHGAEEAHALALQESAYEEEIAHDSGDDPAFSKYYLEPFEAYLCEGELLWSMRRPYWDMIGFYDVYRFLLPTTVQKYTCMNNSLRFLYRKFECADYV